MKVMLVELYANEFMDHLLVQIMRQLTHVIMVILLV